MAQSTTISIFEVAKILRMRPRELADLRQRARKTKAKPQSTAKHRSYHRRQKHGQSVAKIEVDDIPIAHALIASGRLGEGEVLIRANRDAALAEVLKEWAARWAATDRDR